MFVRRLSGLWTALALLALATGTCSIPSSPSWTPLTPRTLSLKWRSECGARPTTLTLRGGSEAGTETVDHQAMESQGGGVEGDVAQGGQQDAQPFPAGPASNGQPNAGAGSASLGAGKQLSLLKEYMVTHKTEMVRAGIWFILGMVGAIGFSMRFRWIEDQLDEVLEDIMNSKF